MLVILWSCFASLVFLKPVLVMFSLFLVVVSLFGHFKPVFGCHVSLSFSDCTW